jgi:alkylation response protein AidB-like acyl-CoA dehydrogenase
MISFAPTEEQEIVRATAADFAHSVLSASARAADEAAALPATLLAAAWALGLVQTIAGAEPGSLEQPTVLNALMLEELAHGDAAAAVAIAAPLGFVNAVAEQGTERQRRELLPLFAGDAPRCAAIAHVDAGWFQVAARPTTATKVAGGFRLEGSKGPRRRPRRPRARAQWLFANAGDAGDRRGAGADGASGVGPLR